MTTVWVICGPGRGVGKTHLAQRLCEALGGCDYAKCGSGRPRAGGPEHFFRTLSRLRAFLASRRGRCDHIVVESNGLALARRRGDVVIFVDGVPAGADRRKDSANLRARADVCVSSGASSRAWGRALAKKLPDKALRKGVCDVLAEHQRYLGRRELAARTKVWLVSGQSHAFGAGLKRLLENVDRLGTLRGAAEAANMSYRYAWERVRRVEKQLGRRLIDREAGGAGGGRSRLSDHGREVLHLFGRLQKDVTAFAERRLARLLEKDQRHG